MTALMERQGFLTRGKVVRFRASHIAEARRSGLAIATMDELLRFGVDPYSVTEFEGNLEVNGGLNAMLTLLIGGGGTTYAHANARLCVGDGNGTVPTAAATDTTLAATTNRYNQACDTSYPSVAAAVLTAQSTFPTGQGNYVWNEWGMDNGGSSGSGAASGLFNHRGVNLGTKTSASAWALQITITQS
jgi:hypothetical protein